MKVSIVRPYNAYGPRDNFDPEISHVIPGIIKRIFANENPLVVWGSGRQTRTFIYVDDLAKGLIWAVEKYPEADPINLGSDEEITLKDLVILLLKITKKNVKIIFDKTKPDGQPRRKGDIRKAKIKLGFAAETGLKKGLSRTIEWYSQHL